MQIDLRVMEPSQFGAAAIYFTGSKAHNIRLRQMAIEKGWILNEYALAESEGGAVIASATEEQVYAALGLPWIPTEIREDTGEIEAALAGDLPDLVADQHLRGDLHVHTSLSGDGKESLEKMLAACAARGYAYVAITDHGEDLAINGATRQQLLAQRRRIAKLQEQYPDMTILQGAELNIGPDGSVDYDPEFLAGFDFGVASVHSAFSLDRATQTARLITAMRNPAVSVIGHLTGRRIGHRPGIDLDIDAVLAVAEETGCALEINGHLDRLDAPADVLRHARERGRGVQHRQRRPRHPGVGQRRQRGPQRPPRLGGEEAGGQHLDGEAVPEVGGGEAPEVTAGSGATRFGNLVLLCRRHHRVAHEGAGVRRE